MTGPRKHNRRINTWIILRSMLRQPCEPDMVLGLALSSGIGLDSIRYSPMRVTESSHREQLDRCSGLGLGEIATSRQHTATAPQDC